jgi:hypothetical protein
VDGRDVAPAGAPRVQVPGRRRLGVRRRGPPRKYVGGVENPAVLVPDCRLPRLALASHTVARAAAGAGSLRAELTFAPGLAGDALDPASLRATLRRDGVDRALPAPVLDAMTGRARVEVSALADGKYTAIVDARDRAGRAAAPLKVVFWVEAERFDWQGAPIYMAMVDRFANGDRANDARPTEGVDPRADYQGGDFQGLRARIADGTLDRLGVRALWIAPVNRNPDGAFLAANGRNRVMGYHGYWPVRAREVDPRLGGEAALRALVAEAHAHGIRVLQDFVVNHVHREHEYFRDHPEWFRTGCVCGTGGCDWTARRLDCLFTDYLPDVNWSVPEAVAEQFADDAAVLGRSLRPRRAPRRRGEARRGHRRVQPPRAPRTTSSRRAGSARLPHRRDGHGVGRLRPRLQPQRVRHHLALHRPQRAPSTARPTSCSTTPSPTGLFSSPTSAACSTSTTGRCRASASTRRAR